VTLRAASGFLSWLLYESREGDADAAQHRRVLAYHTLSFRSLETRGVQLPVVQDLDLLLSGQGKAVQRYALTSSASASKPLRAAL
jgi:hypothetical protein